MARFLYQLPTGAPVPNVARVEAFLRRRGYPSAGVSTVRVAEDIHALVIEGPENPSTVLAIYVDEPTDEEAMLQQQQVALAAALREIRAKSPLTRTPAERATVALVGLMRSVLGPLLPDPDATSPAPVTRSSDERELGPGERPDDG